MPLKLSRIIQVSAPVAALREAAEAALAYDWQRNVGHSMVERTPVGVAACITPWNYPLHQIVGKLAPALLTGCTVVLKPSEIAPSAAIVFAEATLAAGLPKGVFNMVIGRGEEAGAALVADPEVDLVSFTGSTRVGRSIAAVAAGMMRRMTMELGGKSAAILLPGCDEAAAVRAIVSNAFLNSGQTCSALTRLIVHEDRLEAVTGLARAAAERFVPGDPLDAAIRLGPLATQEQRARVLDYIAGGIADGAKLVCGGTDRPEGLDKGYFVHPTIFTGVDPASSLAQEEVFGPVLCILTCTDIDDALRIANGTAFGLAGAVWGPDETSAVAVARCMRAGQVDVNGASFNPAAPFGGFRLSGVGRENGVYGFDAFLEYRSIQMPVGKGAA